MRLTSRDEGDMRPEFADEARRRAILDRRWVFCHQVHGAVVAEVDRDSGRPVADALVTTDEEAALALLGADCALVALASPEGVRGVCHVGWRGLVEEVVAATAAAMRRLGAGTVVARRSAAIHPECYAFSRGDLDAICRQLGEQVRGRTAEGAPALDLPRGVSLALERAAVEELAPLAGCTACDERFFSFRRRGEEGRHALVLAAAR